MSCTCGQQNLAQQDLISHSGLWLRSFYLFGLSCYPPRPPSKKMFMFEFRGEKFRPTVRLPPRWRDGTSQDSCAVTQTLARHLCDVAWNSGVITVVQRPCKSEQNLRSDQTTSGRGRGSNTITSIVLLRCCFSCTVLYFPLAKHLQDS